MSDISHQLDEIAQLLTARKSDLEQIRNHLKQLSNDTSTVVDLIPSLYDVNHRGYEQVIGLLEQCVRNHVEISEKINSVKQILFNNEENYLMKWRRLQQLESNGVPFPNKTSDLNKIQAFAELLASSLLNHRQQLLELNQETNRLPFLFNNKRIVDLYDQQTELFRDIVNQSLIIDNQPKQLMKKGINFVITARFLIGKVLGRK